MASIDSHRSYLAGVKQWKVRNMIQEYLRARQTYQDLRPTKVKNHRVPSFQALKEIGEALHHVKEDHHLIFRRSDEASGRNGHHKLVPGYAETAFIDHVGLLFHKVMVARELLYILEHYAHDEENWEAHFQALQTNLQSLEQLFAAGVEITLNLVRTHSDNKLVLAFLMENYKWIGKCVKIPAGKVMAALVTKVDLSEAFYWVSQYYFESGWFEQAVKAARKCLQRNAKHEGASELIRKAEKLNGARNSSLESHTGLAFKKNGSNE